MSGFADTPKHPNYHYGDLITGAAVRGDAPFVFEKIRKGVSTIALSASRIVLTISGCSQGYWPGYGSQRLFETLHKHIFLSRNA
jgi:hypothetical protein